jgi:hypothetical protein
LGLHKTIESGSPGYRTGQPPEVREAGPTVGVVLETPPKRALDGKTDGAAIENSRTAMTLQGLNCTFSRFSRAAAEIREHLGLYVGPANR